ncbi:FAD-dependent oxidoreductase [soil metagenome]
MATSRRLGLDRRGLLVGGAGFGLVGLGGCALNTAPISMAAPYPLGPPIYPIRAEVERLFDITVCLRPFRAAGPRLDAERIGETLVIHNYGHGGSGWSLSWGSGTQAVRMAMADGPKRVAVIGCGALGLTSAILAQEAGAEVTIYAKDLTPQTRSSRATGTWTPDSRIALTDKAAPGFADRWEEMARTSFKRYRQFLGLPGSPVEWRDHYSVSRLPSDPPKTRMTPPQGLTFAEYGDQIADIMPHGHDLAPGSTPFGRREVRMGTQLQFNVADYAHTLLADFRAAGGKVVHREFNSPAEVAGLPEKVVINCTGYGARALMKDESITPVRGQIAWLVPQAEVTYGLQFAGVNVVSRRDGIVVQDVAGGDMRGYGDENETPDRAEAAAAVRNIAALFDNFGGRSI